MVNHNYYNYEGLSNLSLYKIGNLAFLDLPIYVQTPNVNWYKVGSVSIKPKTATYFGRYGTDYVEIYINTNGEIYAAGGTASHHSYIPIVYITN